MNFIIDFMFMFLAVAITGVIFDIITKLPFTDALIKKIFPEMEE